MSMFKSAAESSDITDSDVEPTAIEPQISSNSEKEPHKHDETPTAPIECSQGSQGPRSLDSTNELEASSSFEDLSTASQDVLDSLDANIDHHRNMMTSSLLEFYCQRRAVDILNAQHPSRNFTPHSPEAQFLGKKLYRFKSQFLTTHGVLTDGTEKDEFKATRQSYRDHLDLLGLNAFEDMQITAGGPRTRPNIESGDQLALATIPNKNHIIETTSQFAKGEGNAQRISPIENANILEGIPIVTRALPSTLRPLFGSSPASMPLFNNPTMPHFSHISRYSVEFSELKVLGRGAFGEVYHVTNHIDGQDYAVKKIPLSQRRLEQLQFGGQNQLETIMKEIRTLARLEHANVVRYYGAWVEQAHIAHSAPFAHQDGPKNEPPHINLPSEESQETTQDEDSRDDPSMGIVFENSENSVATTHFGSVHDDRFLSGIHRLDSHTTTSSRHSRKSSAPEIEDYEDDDIESIPRNFSNASYEETSAFGETDDIFTDGLSQDQSQLQVQRQCRSNQPPPAVILHIQMSLHPISLSSYLSSQATTARKNDDQSPPRRHCFHLIPSLRLMLDIISGVQYLHSKGIVHRDLKPANIFLSAPEAHSLQTCPSCNPGANSPAQFWRPRIGDFGLVADISHINESPHAPDGTVTSLRERPKIQRVVGTEFYRPPLNTSSSSSSCYTDEYKIDEKLDVYALGVILFELIYRLNTKMERQFLLSDLTRGSVSLPDDFATKIEHGEAKLDSGEVVADSLISCIQGMLKPQSEKRWGCQEVKDRLRQVYKSVKKL
ncbi:hypothetical protein N7495_006375 [Penicillium taxi]|uniref:uncharacterized protein n=1 Tax=Penicillium taxi TaxID=168475 RepID=UPI0025452968|nr:uncharacterized protein N7495_006375 [Penicillium taxi]KAJ5894684.1 hypothetical protein N7495_006375 [Penicillium taxi]